MSEIFPHLGRPWVLFLLIPLAFLTLKWGMQKTRYRHSSVALFEGIPTLDTVLLRKASFFLTLALIAFAFSEPYHLKLVPKDTYEARCTVLTVDVSGSMSGRLGPAVSAAEVFAKNLSSEQLGLVLFADRAFFSQNCSSDHEALLTRLRRIPPQNKDPWMDKKWFASGSGTEIPLGLFLPLNELKEREGGRAIILITDAVDNLELQGEDQSEILEELVTSSDVRLYLVIIGGGGYKVVRDFVERVGGRVYEVEVEPPPPAVPTPNTSGVEGGGVPRPQGDSSAQFREIFTEIQNLEKARVAVSFETQRDDLSWVFGFAALIPFAFFAFWHALSEYL